MMIHVMTTHDTHSPLYKLPLQVKSIGVRTGKKSWYWIDTKFAVSHSINKNLGFQIQTAYKWKKILISVLQELFINKDRQLRRSQNKTWVTWKHLKQARKKTLFSKKSTAAVYSSTDHVDGVLLQGPENMGNPVNLYRLKSLTDHEIVTKC